MVHEHVKLQRFQTFIIWLILVVFFSFLFLSYKPEVVNLSNSSDPRLEKNALRAMEAGGRTSVAAAYEAMAAKEAMHPPVAANGSGTQRCCWWLSVTKKRYCR